MPDDERPIPPQPADRPHDPTDAELQSLLSNIDGQIENRLWVQYPVALARVINRGDRIKLGLPTLDENLGGGPYPGSVMVIQGGPFQGKTLLATQFCLYAAHSCSVGALFHDEGLPGSVIRIGQQLGGDKELLEKGDRGEVAKVFARFAELDFHLFKPDEPESTLETFIEQMHDRATKGKREIWLLDSAQTIRSPRFSPRMNATERVTMAVEIVRAFATKFNALAILTSKMSRAGYRHKRDEENIDPIAASRDASDIEYGCEGLLSLHGKPLVNPEIRCPKNRYGLHLPTFTLPMRLDYPRSMFAEVDQKQHEADKQFEKDKRALEKLKKDEETILSVLRTADNGLSKYQLRETLSLAPKAIIAAVESLRHKGAIIAVERDRGMAWKISKV